MNILKRIGKASGGRQFAGCELVLPLVLALAIHKCEAGENGSSPIPQRAEVSDINIASTPNARTPVTLPAALEPLTRAAGPAWTALGPAPIPNGQTGTRSDPVSGRVTCAAVHPTNANIVYVGTAQGGMYRSLNGGTTWTPLMDNALSLAIGAVTIDPVTPTTVFVGTGEGNSSNDSFFGVGLYRIDNADSTTPVVSGPFETRVDGTGTLASNGHAFVGTAINKILVDPNNHNRIFIANAVGVGGVSGNQICCGGSNPVSGYVGLWFCPNALAAAPTFSLLSGIPASTVKDIVFEPGSSDNMLAGGQNGSTVYRSTNCSTASQVPSVSPAFSAKLSTATNIKFAINKVGATVTALAASGESVGANQGKLYKSTDGGATWPTVLTAANGFAGGQGFYDIAVAINAGDSNVIYVGGSTANGIMLKSIDGGTTFNGMTTGLHSDTHAIVIAPSDPLTLYFGSDGGVWKSTDAASNWTSLNNATFNATQFQSLAIHPTDRNFTIGGTQDNGTNMLKPDGTWNRIDFGDGGFALIDQNATDTANVTMYHTYFNQTNSLIGFGRVTSVANAFDGNWSGFGVGLIADPDDPNNVVIPAANGINSSDSVLFYAPMTLGPGNPNTLYFGTDRLYRSTDMGTNMTVVSQGPFVFGVPVSAIGISAQDDNVRIVGLRSGNVFATTTGANPMTDVTGLIPAKYIARAVIDPNAKDTAYVTLSGFGLPAGQHIWKTTTLSGGGATWVASGTGIPDVPVNAFAVDPSNSMQLYAGTDVGVFNSTDGGATWAAYGTGLPRVAVFDLAIQNIFHVLRIATHGKGLWEIPAVSAPPPGTGIAPLITSALTASGTVGVAFSTYTITATGTAPITFTAAPVSAGLTFSGNTISGTPTAAGVTNVALTAANGTLPNDAKTLVITIAPAPTPPKPPALTFASAPTATPNPALVGQPVAFSASATGAAPVTYTWSYGDSKSDAGQSVSHPFSPAGSYTVTVVATDTVNTPVSMTVAVTISPLTGGGPGAGIGTLPGEVDSDGDGFSDAVEIAAGSDPNDPNSTPGNVKAPVKGTMTNAVLKITKTKKSSNLTLSGTLHIPKGFADGQTLVADIGGFIQKFKLSKGSGKSGKDSVKIGIKSKKGAVLEQDAKYKLTLNGVPATLTPSSSLLIVIGGIVYSK